MPEPALQAVKAVLLDVDGTLYRPGPLRIHMALTLISRHLGNPRQLWSTVQIIRAFRKAQEELRIDNAGHGQPLDRQYRLAAQATRRPLSHVRRVVDYWMFRQPLPHLARYGRDGLLSFLETCRQRRLKVGALSDYPPQDKLAAMEIAPLFQMLLCSAGPEIGAFKPAPDGILLACAQWAIRPAACLYIGDRPDVDGLAAQRAGAKFILMGRPAGNLRFPAAKDFNELAALMGF